MVVERNDVRRGRERGGGVGKSVCVFDRREKQLVMSSTHFHVVAAQCQDGKLRTHPCTIADVEGQGKLLGDCVQEQLTILSCSAATNAIVSQLQRLALSRRRPEITSQKHSLKGSSATSPLQDASFLANREAVEAKI